MKITVNNLNDVFRSEQASIETMELKGYKLIDDLFVDSSGAGAENEPALTCSQFLTRLKTIVMEYGQVHTSLTEVGQFQVYVGVFKKSNKRKAKRIANNTLQYQKDDQTIIRFHNTDIFQVNGTDIRVNAGGHYTVTTKARINESLAKYTNGCYVFQRDFEWYIVIDGKEYDFSLYDNFRRPVI